jgi:phospholipid/cholesterol/gamma-HCH transport system ATP-binding protein
MVQHHDPAQTTVAPAVEVRGLRKHSLTDVDLMIGPRDRVAVIGKTGQGKTVLLRCVLGLLSPDRGQVRLFGRLVNRRSISTPGVGVAFQSPGLFDGWTVAENLRAATKKRLDVQAVSSLLGSVGLGSISPESSVTQLSGGQQKRLSMLRAILRGTDLLVLDEPMSGLDPRTSALVAEFLLREFDERPRALLLITHDYETAVRVCDRVVRVANGRAIDVPFVRSGDSGDDIGALRDALGDEDGLPLPTQRPAARGVLSLTFAFMAVGLPVSAIAMALMGMMLVAQSAHVGVFDVSRYVPGALVLAIFREMAPLVVGFLLASRIGSRVAAELAAMSYAGQIDAIRNLGFSPLRRLLPPFLVSATIAFPVCMAIGALTAVVVGAFYAGLPAAGLSIGTRRFFDLARESFESRLFISVVLKGVSMAVAVVSVSYWCGTRPVFHAAALGRAVTLAAVLGSISVVLVDVLGSAFFFH